MDDFSFFSKISEQFNVSRETFEKLIFYKNLLIKWQKSINLVSRGTLEHFWTRHVLDSLQIIEYIRGSRVLDIGSGGGFPGMIIALCGDLDVTCVEADGRKMAFLEEIARLARINVKLKNIRIERLEDFDFDTVCARGFSSLVELVSLASIFSKQKYGVFLKGMKAQTELSEANKIFDFKYDIFDSKSDKKGCIVVVSEIFDKFKNKTYGQNI
jgi:16S rRNA (guanine527-N7)-methyltransferase